MFIGEPIEVYWDKPPYLEKRPYCPDRFLWGDDLYEVEALLQEWRDFQRRGRMASNMRPEHLERARIKGSRGVGRFYFRVRVPGGDIYELYYDRAAKDADHSKGAWFLDRVQRATP